MAQNDPIKDLHAGIGNPTGNIGPGGTGTGTGSDIGTGGTSFGVTSGSDLGGSSTAGSGSSTGTDEQFCTHCGQSLSKGGGIEGLLASLRSQFENVDVDEYLNTAREYLKGSSSKVTSYTKENPAKVAAGVAALAVGAGLIYAAVNRDKTDTSNASTTTTVDPPPGGKT